MDVVIAESATILIKLLSFKDQAVLIGWYTFFILDLGLHGLNGIGSLNIEGDNLAREGKDEDLHASILKTDKQVNGCLILNIVVSEGFAVLQILTLTYQNLLICGDALYVLDFGFHAFNCVSVVHGESENLVRGDLQLYFH